MNTLTKLIALIITLVIAANLMACAAVQTLPVNYMEPIPGEINAVFGGTTKLVIQDALAGKKCCSKF